MLSLVRLKREFMAQLIVGVYFVFTLIWFYLTFFQEQGSLWHSFFTNTYGIVALIGGIFGLIIAGKWGGYKSLFGKAILFLSLGLLAQEFGQVIYIYYIQVLGVEVPYPSWGDVGYFGSVLFYIYGAYLLARASGVTISLRSIESKMIAVVVPAVLLIISYAVFLQGYDFTVNSPLTIFLDFGYPFGQAIYVSIALLSYLLSRKLLGGIMKNKILFLLLALTVQYFCDFIFLYQVHRDTWYVGGINDFMYLTSYALMSLGLIQLKAVYDDLTGKGKRK